MMICRQKLAKTRKLNGKSGSTPTSSQSMAKGEKKNSGGQADKREEIKQLLEESGADSSWIMNYLFEDQQNDIDSEKPW